LEDKTAKTAEEIAKEDTAAKETAATAAGRNEEDNILTPFQDLSISSRVCYSAFRSPPFSFHSPPTTSARQTLHFQTMMASS
jgi:hypothetical protein